MSHPSRTLDAAPAADAPLIALLVLTSAISPLALNIFVPAMPVMQKAFEVDFGTVQLTLSLYFVGIALGQIIIGPLSDRFGRRPVLIAGLSVFVAASALCALAPSIEALIFGRIAQAAGGCAGLVLSRAIVRDLFERDQAASMIGYVTMGMALAPMVSPAIGGAIDTWIGWRAIFVFAGIVGAAILMLTVAGLPETNRTRAPTSPRALAKAYGELARSRVFWGYTLTAAFGSLCFFAFVSGASYVMMNIMGRTSVEYGFYFPMAALGYISGNFISGRFTARIGAPRMMTMGCLVTSLGVALIAGGFALGFEHPLVLFAPMLLVGGGNGLMLPSAMAGSVSVRPDLAGAASGLSGTMQMGFGAIASIAIGASLDRTVWPMVVVMGLGAGAALISLALLNREAFGRSSRA